MNLDFFELCSRIDPQKLQKNRPMTDISQVLLFGEGFVTCAMRSAGAEEKYITGDGSDFEKFRELCRVYPFFEGNVVQYVCREVLSEIFGIGEELSEKNCEEIWTKTADFLLENPLTPADLIRRFNVSKIGLLTDISDDLSTFERLDVSVHSVLCPDSVFSVDKRGFKKEISKLERAFGAKVDSIPAFDKAILRLTERFIEDGCSFAVVNGLSREDFGKNDYYHAEQALEKAISTDGNISADEARDFRRYAVGKFLEICREKKLDLLLEFSAPTLEILPDIKIESPVERRIWLNFSGNERPLMKEGFIDLRADLQAQFADYAARFAVGNLPIFFVGTANPAELCLHGFYRAELQKYAKK